MELLYCKNYKTVLKNIMISFIKNVIPIKQNILHGILKIFQHIKFQI